MPASRPTLLAYQFVCLQELTIEDNCIPAIQNIEPSSMPHLRSLNLAVNPLVALPLVRAEGGAAVHGRPAMRTREGRPAFVQAAMRVAGPLPGPPPFPHLGIALRGVCAA